MSDNKFPKGWDEARVKSLIQKHEEKTDEEIIEEDDAAAGTRSGQAVVVVPDELLPAIRQLLASHKSA
ncbi:MAG: hypothetical protein K2W96_02370 [Gemmataceae bacterium]|nr:hypothetical protein [Gemmataceae bacterium]